MATVLESFIVEIDGNTRGLVRGISRGLASMRRLAGRMTGLAKITAGLGVAFAGLFGFQVSRSIKGQADALDALSKAHRLLNFDELKNLQAFANAAKESGIETEQFTRLLTKSFNSIEEASKGTGEGVTALESIGLSAKELTRLSGEEKITALADAFNKVEDPAAKLAAAFDLFGGRGTAMITLFDSLKEKGIEPFLKELKKSNQALTDKGGLRIEKMNDALTRLGNAYDGIINQTLVHIAPAVQKAAKHLTAFLSDKGRLRAFTNEIKDLLQQFRDLMEFLKKNGVKETIRSVELPLSGGQGDVGDLADFVKKGSDLVSPLFVELGAELKRTLETLRLFSEGEFRQGLQSQAEGSLLGRAIDATDPVGTTKALIDQLSAQLQNVLAGKVSDPAALEALLSSDVKEAKVQTVVLRGIARNLQTGNTTVFQ